MLNRFFANFYDSLITTALFVPLLLLIHYNKINDNNGLTPVILMLVFPAGYFLLKDGLFKGRSFGKKGADLVVIQVKNNRPANVFHSIARCVPVIALGIVPNFPYAGAVLEIIIVLFASDGRKLGDMIAGTQVINKSDYSNKTNHNL